MSNMINEQVLALTNPEEIQSISENSCFELLRLEIEELSTVSCLLALNLSCDTNMTMTNGEKLRRIQDLEFRSHESVQKINNFMEQISSKVNKKIVSRTEELLK